MPSQKVLNTMAIYKMAYMSLELVDWILYKTGKTQETPMMRDVSEGTTLSVRPSKREIKLDTEIDQFVYIFLSGYPINALDTGYEIDTFSKI
jgi:hypothetical protein